VAPARSLGARPVGPTAEQVADWRHLFTDPGPWRRLIAEILLRHGLGRLVSAEVDVPGSNAVFVVNHSLIVKIAWPHFLEDFPREIEALRLARRCPELTVPEVLAHGVIEGELPWHYMVLERLPGRPLVLVRDQVPRADLLALAQALGRGIDALHAMPRPSAGPLAFPPDHWLELLRRQTADAPRRHALGAECGRHLVAQMPALLAEVADELLCTQPQVPLHCDLTADHLLVERRGGRWTLSGLIDFGDADVGHADYEWIALHLDAFACEAELMRRFLEAYGYDGLDDRFARRMTAYSLLHRFADLGPWIGRLGGPEVVGSLDELCALVWGPVVA